jgi:hypothetical protein
MGVDFETADASLSEMRFYSFVYFDSLTKDTLIQKVLVVLRATTLARFTIAQSASEIVGQSDAASDLFRFVPPTHGSLTAAS